MKQLLFILMAAFICSGVWAQCPTGYLRMNTQHDVDSFMANYPNCTELTGTLQINGYNSSDPINNLNGLSNLTHIGGILAIERNNSLTSLAGLENIITVGSSLIIEYNNALSSLTGLGNLTTSETGFSIRGNDNLVNLTGIENLSFVGGLSIDNNNSLSSLSGIENLDTIEAYLAIRNNPNLTLCNATGICNYIENGGIPTLTNNGAVCNDINDIAVSCGISLDCPYGTINFSTQAEIDSFAINYPNCMDILGNIIIEDDTDNPTITNLSGFSQITSVGGNLNIQNNPLLTNLSGFSNLTSAGGISVGSNSMLLNLMGFENLDTSGEVSIEGNENLSSLVGLGGLTAIVSLNIDDNYSLSDLTGLDNLSSVEGYTIIRENASLVSLAGLENLTIVNGGLLILKNPSLSSLTGLENLTNIGSRLHIGDNDALVNLSGLNGLTSVGGELIIGGATSVGNRNLSNLNGLENLTFIGENLEISSNNALVNLSGLNALTTIEGSLLIGGYSGETEYENGSLSSLTGLESLTTIGENLELYNNDALKNLSGLDNLTSIGGTLQIGQYHTSHPWYSNNHGNQALVSMQGLENLNTLSSLHIVGNSNLVSLMGLESLDYTSMTWLKILRNKRLSICSISSICDYVNNGGNVIVQYNGGSNCSSVANIISSCAGSCAPDNFIFTTQASIDNFSNHYSCIDIPGDVEIRGHSITNLNGLSQITSIQGDLNIQSDSALQNLSGLDNLNYVGGKLTISNNEALIDLEGLNNLTSIGSLTISNNGALTDLTELNNLTSIGNLTISNNEALTDLTGLNNLTSIGSLTISDNETLVNLMELNVSSVSGLTITNNDNLQHLYGLENLTSVNVTISITNNKNLLDLKGLDMLNRVGKHLYIDLNDALQHLHGLENLVTVGDVLTVRGNKNLLDLKGLDMLNYVGENLAINNNDVLIDLTGIGNLSSIKDNLYIKDNSQLAICDIEPICHHLQIGGSANISGNAPGCNSIAEVEAACMSATLCPWGDVTLNTQQQIDDFSTTYPNCTEITGDLHIGGTPDSPTMIDDLTPLSQLTSIQGKLTIAKNDALTSLSGLENLNTIGGDIYIGFNPVLSSLTNWNNLTSTGGSLIIRQNALTDLTGFNSLTSIGRYLNIGPSPTLTSLSGLESLTTINGFVYVQKNPTLNSLTGLDNIDHTTITNLKVLNNPQLNVCNVHSVCDYLENGGTATIGGNASGCNSQAEVEAACMPVTVCPQGDITLASQQLIDSFASRYPGCTELPGSLTVGSVGTTTDINNVNGLVGITSVAGSLNIRHNKDLITLSGLEDLTSVGYLNIMNNNALTSITALQNLSSINALGITSNDSLIDLAGLENITSADNIYISGNDVLTSLMGLKNLASLSGNATISGNDVLTSLSGLENLVSIEGSLDFIHSPGLLSLSGLDNLTTIGSYLRIHTTRVNDLSGLGSLSSIGGYFYIADNFSLTSLAGIENLSSVGGPFNIESNDKLTTLTGLGNLSTVGSFSVEKNNSLTAFAGLESLSSVGSELKIWYNLNLSTLAGLDNITSIGGELIIKGNKKLYLCGTPGICSYLSDGGAVAIGGNASGCNNKGEINGTCTVVPPNPCDGTASTDSLTHIFDQDVFIDGVGFANNPTITFTDPATDADATLSDISLELYFRLNGNSCENEIAIQITDPAGNTQPLTAYTTCDGGTGLYYVNLDVPSGNTTGEIDDWTVEFDDTNDQNAGYEYSVRFARLNYVATTKSGIDTQITDEVSATADTDLYIDGVGFANNSTYTFTDPATPTVATLSNISLELYFRLNGSSCENEIAIQITDPTGNTQPLTAYTTCDGGTGLYYVNLNVPSGNTTGNYDKWIVEFDDTNDQNTGYEYSVRFGKLTYTTAYDLCDTEATIAENTSAQQHVGTSAQKNISTSVRQQVSTLKLYPVPASQYLNVEYFSDNANSANIEILSNEGKILMSEKAALQEGMNTIQMDINNLPAGHYHIRMYNADDVQMQSFIKIAP